MGILKWGLIGAGDIAKRRIAPALRDIENCELVSISRAKSADAETFARDVGALAWYSDWRDQIEDDAIDAVYIATPVFLHSEQAIAAARSGKHVLCEKPMALSVDECDAMIAAAASSGVRLGIAYYRRFYPVLDRIKELIKIGEIGDVSVAQMNAFEYFDPSPSDPRHWLLEREKSGGGPMMDFGCHRLEVLTNLFGRVNKLRSMVSDRIFHRGVEDTATAILGFDNGCSATVTITHGAVESRDTLDIYGTRGSIHVPILNKGDMVIRTGSNERTESYPNSPNTHRPLIENFAEAVLSGREPIVGGQTGRMIASLIEEIYRAG